MTRADCAPHRLPLLRAAPRKRFTSCIGYEKSGLDLTDEQIATLLRELDRIIENDRFPLSPRILTLKAILAKIRPEPARERLPDPKRYEPPRAGQRRR